VVDLGEEIGNAHQRQHVVKTRGEDFSCLGRIGLGWRDRQLAPCNAHLFEVTTCGTAADFSEPACKQLATLV
jgi:hypothetical protein